MPLDLGQLNVKLGADLSGLQAAAQAVQKTAAQMQQLGQTASTAFGQADRAAEKAAASTQRFTQSAQGATSALSSLQSIAVRIAAVLTAREVIQAADSYNLLQTRIRLVTSSAQELAVVQQQLFQLSQDTRVSFGSTVELYTRLARSSQSLGVSQEQVLQVTRALNQAVQVSGATAQEASAGLIQLAQGLASGRLQGDELRSVLEQLPEVGRQIAAGLNVPFGQLRQLASEGKITAEEIFKALLKQAPEIEAAFGKMTVTVEQSFTVLKNSLLQAVGQIDDATNFSGLLADAILEVAKAAETLSFQDIAGIFGTIRAVAEAAILPVKGLAIAIATLSGGADAGRDVIAFFDQLSLKIEGFELKLQLASKTNEKFNTLIGEFSGVAKDVAKGLEAPAPALATLAKLYEEGKKSGANFSAENIKILQTLGVLSPAATKAAESVGTVDKAAERAAKALANQNASLRDQISVQKQINVVLGQVAAGTLKQADADAKIAAIKTQLKKGSDSLTDALGNEKAITEQLTNTIKQNAEAAKAQAKAIEEQTDALRERLDQQLQLIRSNEDEIALNQRLAGIFEQVTAGALSYADAEREIAIETTKAQLASQGFAGDLDKTARALVSSREGFDRAREGAEAYKESVEDALLSTADLKTIGQAILEGTQDLPDVFADLGKTMGIRLVEGILFGKGGTEQAILGNFNQLLGVGAQGLFGQQGIGLGKTLVGGILQGSGFDLTSVSGAPIGSGFSVVNPNQQGSIPGIFGGSSSGGGFSLSKGFQGLGAGLAGFGLGEGARGLFGIGQSKEGNIGAKVGAGLGGIGGAIAGSFLPGIGTVLGAGIGSFLGDIVGGLFGGLFASVPTKGTQIRKGVVEFLEDIEVSFAKELDSGDYFFEESKKLAEKMFGGDFLAASKSVLTTKAGPEIAGQLQALGTALTADQAIKLGKSVEQTGTTFGNLLIDNLGIDAIPDAIAEVVEKSGLSLESLTGKLTEVFEKNKIGAEFYKTAILGAVGIFTTDLPEAIGASKIALKSFTDDGIFSLSEFQAQVEKATGIFDTVSRAAVEALRNSNTGAEAATIFAEQLRTGLEELAVGQFISKFLEEQLFTGIDLSDGLGAEEIATLTQRVGEARTALAALQTSLGQTGEAADETASQLVTMATVAALAFGQLTISAKSALDAAFAADSETPKRLTFYLFGGEIKTVGNQLGSRLGNEIGTALREQIATAVGDGLQDAIIEVAIQQSILAPLQAALTELVAAGFADGVLSGEELAEIANLARQGAEFAEDAAATIAPALSDAERVSKLIQKDAEATADAFAGLDINPLLAQAEQFRAIIEGTVPPVANTVSVPGFANGGLVGGSGSGDSVLGLLNPREFVVTPEATAANFGLLKAMNEGLIVRHFAAGGIVGFGSAAGKGFGSSGGLSFGRIGNTPFSSSKEGGGGVGGVISPEIRQLIDELLNRIRSFLGQAADPVKAVREEFQALTQDLNKNRRALERAGQDVDGLLTQLAQALPERLREAVREANSALVSGIDQLKGDLDRLLLGADSGLSAFARNAILEEKRGALQGQLSAATSTSEQARIAQELSQVLQEQIQISPFDRFGQDFQDTFNRNTGEIQGLVTFLEDKLADEFAKAGVSQTNNTEVNLTFQVTLPAGADAKKQGEDLIKGAAPIIEDMIEKSILSGKGGTAVKTKFKVT